jgi:hypothetical protein
MLYNSNWDKPDVFSLESLISWLEKRPADKAYDYTDCRGCLLAQYFTAMGYECVEVAPMMFDHKISGNKIFQHFSDQFETVALCEDRTFGAALKLARRLRKRAHAV